MNIMRGPTHEKTMENLLHSKDVLTFWALSLVLLPFISMVKWTCEGNTVPWFVPIYVMSCVKISAEALEIWWPSVRHMKEA